MHRTPLLLLLGLAACGGSSHDGTYRLMMEFKKGQSTEDSDTFPTDYTYPMLAKFYSGADGTFAMEAGDVIMGTREGADFSLDYVHIDTDQSCGRYEVEQSAQVEGTFIEAGQVEGTVTMLTKASLNNCDGADNYTYANQQEWDFSGIRINSTPNAHPGEASHMGSVTIPQGGGGDTGWN